MCWLGYWTRKEILSLLWNQNVHYLLHNSLHQDLTVSQFNPVHIHLFQQDQFLILSFHLYLGVSSNLSFWVFLVKILISFLICAKCAILLPWRCRLCILWNSDFFPQVHTALNHNQKYETNLPWIWLSSGMLRPVITLMMEAVNTPETSVCVYHTTQRYIAEGSHLHILRCENLKSYIFNAVWVYRLATKHGLQCVCVWLGVEQVNLISKPCDCYMERSVTLLFALVKIMACIYSIQYVKRMIFHFVIC
jgi:hypothetical protein